MKRLRIISLLFILILLSACSNGNNVTSLRIKNELLNIEISADELSRTKGLSGRESLGENWGMIFIFEEEAKHNFWMKDMNFPLDILYIKNDEIVEIFKNVKILDNYGEFTEIFPKEKADKVLELNAGWCDIHDVRVGDKIEYPY